VLIPSSQLKTEELLHPLAREVSHVLQLLQPLISLI